MKSPANFLIFSYVVLVVGVALSFFLLVRVPTAPGSETNYGAALVYLFMIFLLPLLPAFLLSLVFKKLKFLLVLGWMNILAAVGIVAFVWYMLGMIFIT